MRGRTRHAHVARGYLARLAVVVGVLAGLVLANGVHCTDGMATMAIEHPAGSGVPEGTAQNSAAALVTVGVGHHSPDVVTVAHRVTAVSVVADAGAASLAGARSLDSDGPCGGLATCLAVIIAALAVIARLRPASLGIFTPIRTPGRVAAICTVRPDGPSLAELCLLRT